MKVLKWTAICFLVLIAVIGILLFGMRFHDGPMGMIAGGPFKTGQTIQGSEPDWRFVKDKITVEFQLLDPARSRTTWIVGHNNRVFIPSGYMTSTLGKIWKQWPLEAEKDGRAILRVDDNLYQRTLVRRMNGDFMKVVLSELNRKYGVVAGQDAIDSGMLWIFELVPRKP